CSHHTFRLRRSRRGSLVRSAPPSSQRHTSWRVLVRCVACARLLVRMIDSPLLLEAVAPLYASVHRADAGLRRTSVPARSATGVNGGGAHVSFASCSWVITIKTRPGAHRALRSAAGVSAHSVRCPL